MNNTTIAEKIELIFKFTKQPQIIFVMLFAVTLLAIVAVKNKKINRLILISSYILLSISLILKYKNTVINMVNYLIDNFFISIYFPNLIIFVIMILTSNIIVLYTIIKKETPNIIKFINIIMYSIITYLFTIILNIIFEKNITHFTQIILFENKELHSIIESVSVLATIWFVFLILYKMILKFQFVKTNQRKDSLNFENEPQKRKLPDYIKETVIPTYAINMNKANTKEHIIPVEIVEKRVRILPENIKEIRAPRMIKDMTKNNIVNKPIEKIVEKRVRILPENIKEIRAPKQIVNMTNVQIDNNKPIEKIVEKRVRILPENIKEIRSPRYAKNLPRYNNECINTTVNETKELNTLLEKKRRNKIEVQEIDKLLQPMYDNILSIDDYREMRDILKEKKLKQNIQNQYLSKDNKKYDEIRDLYKSTNN